MVYKFKSLSIVSSLFFFLRYVILTILLERKKCLSFRQLQTHSHLRSCCPWVGHPIRTTFCSCSLLKTKTKTFLTLWLVPNSQIYFSSNIPVSLKPCTYAYVQIISYLYVHTCTCICIYIHTHTYIYVFIFIFICFA